jgi:hypothetical protein
MPALAACGGGASSGDVEPFEDYGDPDDPIELRPGEGGLFGPGGLQLLGGGDDAPDSGIGVNSYLWRAALDTVAFMPVTSADPFGGVIITDWYTPPDAPGERFKLNVYVLDRTLRADGIRVAVFRQERQDGEWVDAEVAAGTASRLEEAILTRAREFRLAAIQGQQ